MKDFIGVYENALSPEFCNGLIEYYKWCKKNQKTWRRENSLPTMKNDEACSISPINQSEINFVNDNLSPYLNEFNEVFWNKCYAEYAKTYYTLNELSRHTVFSYKLQETLPSEGYHIWHCEQGCIEHSHRIAAYIVYLNDVMHGGETEFLYQSKRVPPTQGTVLIFPSSFTHSHRGNPPLSGAKYILTGWLEFS